MKYMQSGNRRCVMQTRERDDEFDIYYNTRESVMGVGMWSLVQGGESVCVGVAANLPRFQDIDFPSVP